MHSIYFIYSKQLRNDYMQITEFRRWSMHQITRKCFADVVAFKNE